MKILITGASGFIGTNIVHSLLSKKYELLNVDINFPKREGALKYWTKIDIRKLDDFRNIVLAFRPDYILHLAARTDLEGNTLEDYSTNVIGVKNLMEIVALLPNLKKVVITSSMLVCHGGYYPKDQYDYAPTTVYGESKVETEKRVWANKPHCDWAIIRPTSIWGPWFGIPYRNFFDMIISRKYFHIGNKGCTKTYGYVGNAVYQIERILFSDTYDEGKKVFFIGDNPATNIEEWGNEIADELKISIPKMPFVLVKCAALFGDVLKKIGVDFPLTSFRLKNMTTNNIINLSDTYDLAPNPPYTRVEGIKQTLEWMNRENK